MPVASSMTNSACQLDWSEGGCQPVQLSVQQLNHTNCKLPAALSQHCKHCITVIQAITQILTSQ